MPITDWNWFFSSVAQSAAAIVGIFGAFIVTKILANQSAFAEKSRRIRELITLGQKIEDRSRGLSVDWYHGHDSAEELEKLEKLLEEDSTQTPESLYEKLRFSPYIARADAIETIARRKSNREQRIERERQEMLRSLEQLRSEGLPQAFAQRPASSDLLGFNASMRMHLRPQLDKEREEIDSMYTEAKHHVRVVADFYGLTAPNPESASVITAALTLILALFFAGVIYPLSFMPLPTAWQPDVSLAGVPAFLFSLRGALLGVISLLFTAMLAMFFVMNVCMKYSPSLLDELERYSHVSAYSNHFASREENDGHLAGIQN